MLNKCCFIGNLGRDPEIRSTQAGKEIGNLSLGVTEKWKDTSGEKKERTEWVRVVIFSEGLVKIAKSYLKKGSKVYIEGQLQTRKWTDKDGAEKYSTEVVLQGFDAKLIMLNKVESDVDGREDMPAHQAKAPTSQTPYDDSEIPF